MTNQSGNTVGADTTMILYPLDPRVKNLGGGMQVHMIKLRLKRNVIKRGPCVKMHKIGENIK